MRAKIILNESQIRKLLHVPVGIEVTFVEGTNDPKTIVIGLSESCESEFLEEVLESMGKHAVSAGTFLDTESPIISMEAFENFS